MATKVKSKSRYMKTGNIVDTTSGLAPNPEVKPKVVKKTLTKKANANAPPKKPSPPKNKQVIKAPVPKPAPNSSKKAKTPSKFVAKKKANAPNPQTNKSKPKYRFNSPASLALTPQNFEDLFILEGKGESREEFKRKM